MLTSKFRELIKGKTDEPTAKVKVLRPIRIKPANGDLTEAHTGDIYDVSEKDAFSLAGSGAVEIIPSSAQIAERKVREEEAKTLIPPCPEPGPLPPEYADLPKPFGDAWTLAEKRRCLQRHADQIAEKLRMEWAGINGDDEKLAQVSKVLDGRERLAALDKLLSLRVRVFDNDPRRTERITKLKDALYQAWEALAEWQTRKEDLRWKTKFAHDQELIAEHGRASKAAKALEQVGFELFQIRIAGLDLMEYEQRRMFARSHLGHRCTRPVGSLSDCRQLLHEPDGNHLIYLGISLMSCAGLYRQYKARADELEAELKAVEKELATAKKAAA